MRLIFKIFVFIHLIHGSTFNLSAQNKTLDSLNLLLKQPLHDTVRCLVLANLTNRCSENDLSNYNDRLCEYAQSKLKQTHDKAEIVFFKKYYAVSLSNKGFIAAGKADLKSALELFNKSLLIYTEVSSVAFSSSL